MKFYYIFGPVLAIIAMLFWANARVKKEKGIEYKIAPRLFLIGAVVLFHLLFNPYGDIWDKLAMLTGSFGLGLIVNVAYLAYHQAFPKVTLGLGVVAFAVSGLLWGVGNLIGIGWEPIERDKAESVLVELGPDDDIKELYPILETYKADFEKAFPMVDMDEDEDLAQYYQVWVAKEDISALLNDLKADKENVDFAEFNAEVTLGPEISSANDYEAEEALDFGCNDPKVRKQWWFQANRSNKMFNTIKKMDPQKKAVVAIVDTGVDADHEDLDDVFGKSPGKKDVHGHGTHCAGLAGGETNNKKGIASLNYKGKFITIRGYQGLSDDGWGTLEGISEAIIKAAEDGADVISMSLGGYHPEPPHIYVEAIEYARSLGSIVVVAAGNSYGNAEDHSPANVPGVICVAAVNKRGKKTGFSNTNETLKMPISAPGKDIYSTLTGGGYGNMSGTSMATPIVSGLVGFMRAMDPNITEKEVYQILKETGTAPAKGDKIGNLVSPDKVVYEMEKRAS